MPDEYLSEEPQQCIYHRAADMLANMADNAHDDADDELAVFLADVCERERLAFRTSGLFPVPDCADCADPTRT